MSRYSIDFIAVNYKSLDYAEILVRSIEKFVNADYNIYIVDNSDQIDELQKINKSLNVIKGNNDVEQENAPSPQSAAHAASVQLGISSGSSDYICICDIDVCFLNYWIGKIVAHLDNEKLRFITHRYEDFLGIARPQFMLFKRKWYEENNFVFNANYKDTGGFLTQWVNDHKEDYGVIPNSYNQPSFKNDHILREIKNGEQAFLDDGTPFLFHHGRGTIGDGRPSRKQWFEVLDNYLLNDNIPVTKFTRHTPGMAKAGFEGFGNELQVFTFDNEIKWLVI